jgi:hypothetical protein
MVTTSGCHRDCCGGIRAWRGDVMAEEISLDKTSDADGDKKSDPAIQRLQIYVGLVKFLIGTVALGAITFFFNEQYRNAQLDLEKEKSNHAIQLQESRPRSNISASSSPTRWIRISRFASISPTT